MDGCPSDDTDLILMHKEKQRQKKKKNVAPQRQKAIKLKIDKLLEDEFTGNIQLWNNCQMMVKKGNAKRRMCRINDLIMHAPKYIFLSMIYSPRFIFSFSVGYELL